MSKRETIQPDADELRYHGGNINLAQNRFPRAPRPWIDLSTGINPIAYPIGIIPPHVWSSLPESRALADLEFAARSAYGAGPEAEVVAVPGTQSLIQWLCRIVPARRVGILGFTYGEHEACWRAVGADVATVHTPDDLLAFDVGVVVNPNNPDGRYLPPSQLAAVTRSLAARGGTLIVDEAFMDVLHSRDSIIPTLPSTGIVVLRSFGKIYGLAGLRLGFAVTSADVGMMLRRAIGPWPVSGPAIEIGQRALSDRAWLDTTLARLRNEANRLDGLLRAVGFDIAGGTPLFRLATRPNAANWFEQLCQAGILTRPFHSKPDWLRFGVPHASADWERLRTALHSR